MRYFFIIFLCLYTYVGLASECSQVFSKKRSFGNQTIEVTTVGSKRIEYAPIIELFKTDVFHMILALSYDGKEHQQHYQQWIESVANALDSINNFKGNQTGDSFEDNLEPDLDPVLAGIYALKNEMNKFAIFRHTRNGKSVDILIHETNNFYANAFYNDNLEEYVMQVNQHNPMASINFTKQSSLGRFKKLYAALGLSLSPAIPSAIWLYPNLTTGELTGDLLISGVAGALGLAVFWKSVTENHRDAKSFAKNTLHQLMIRPQDQEVILIKTKKLSANYIYAFSKDGFTERVLSSDYLTTVLKARLQIRGHRYSRDSIHTLINLASKHGDSSKKRVFSSVVKGKKNRVIKKLLRKKFLKLRDNRPPKKK